MAKATKNVTAITPEAEARSARAKAKVKKQMAEFKVANKEITEKRGIKPFVTLTPALMEKICERIAMGEPVFRILRSDKMPSRMEFYRQCWRQKEFGAMYKEAKAMCGEMLGEEMKEDADDALTADPERVQAYKLVVNTKQWLATRLQPKVFGEKVVLAGDTENPLVTQVITTGADLASKIRGKKK